MTADDLKKEILEKTAEYFRLVHGAKTAEPFTPGKSRVNYAGRVFDEREMQNLVEASLEFWLTYGHWSRDFEKGLAAYLGVRFALLVNSPKTKAVMLAHTLGNPFNVKAVKAFCEKHNLWLIEDNCDALGSKYDGRFTGTWGDIGTSSFYPPHHMTMGEGGAVYTDNPLLKKIALSIRDWGRDCWCESGVDNTCGCRFTKQFGTLPVGYDHKYVYSHFGYNLKATDLQAAVGCAQLEKFPSFVEKRKANFARLYEGLKDLPQLRLFEKYEESDPSWFGFLMTVKPDAGFTRNDLAKHLESANIQTRNLFAGNIIRHPCFETMREGIDYRVAGSLANTDTIMNSSLWIGLYPGMGDAKIDYMIDVIMKFCLPVWNNRTYKEERE